MQNEYLAHFGVKGMKWGVWNDETRRKRMGGTGRRRIFGKKDRVATVSKKAKGKKGLQLEQRPDSTSYSASKAQGYYDTSEKTQAEVKRLQESSRQIMDGLNDAYGNAMTAVKEAAKNPELRKEALSEMKKGFVSPKMVDDDEYLSWVAKDLASELLTKYASDTKAGKKVNAYESKLNGWYDDVYGTTDRIVSEIGDRKIKSLGKPSTTYKDVVERTLLDSAENGGRFMSYVARHGVWEEALYNDDEYFKVEEKLAKQIEADFRKLK